MNPPRIICYVTPSMSDKEIMETPEDQGEVVAGLIRGGFHPMVDSARRLTETDVKELNGFVWIWGQDFFIDCDCYRDFHGGPIFALIFFVEPLFPNEMDIVKSYMAPYFGCNYGRRVLTRSMKKLVDQNIISF